MVTGLYTELSTHIPPLFCELYADGRFVSDLALFFIEPSYKSYRPNKNDYALECNQISPSMFFYICCQITICSQSKAEFICFLVLTGIYWMKSILQPLTILEWMYRPLMFVHKFLTLLFIRSCPSVPLRLLVFLCSCPSFRVYLLLFILDSFQDTLSLSSKIKHHTM